MPKPLLYNARVRRESELPAFAGVTFILRRMSELRRTELRETLYELEAEYLRLLTDSGVARQKMDEHIAGVNAERAANDQPPLPPEEVEVPSTLAKMFTDLERDVRSNQAKQDLAYLNWGLEAIEGLNLCDDDGDGRPMTPQLLYEEGDRDLFQEAVRFVKQAAGLTVDERKNSSLLSTSTPEDGKHDENTSASSVTPNDSF
jgi:hypothetical protein